MNPSQFLATLVAVTLDDSSVETSSCKALDKALVSCLKDDARLDRRAARECVLCPVARTRESTATTCVGFEREGFCADCETCKEEDCPTACWPEFDEWLRCTLEAIGCPDICKEDDWDRPWTIA
mmetsp:Transcript_16348/g.35565  ORF Transcript_16348/g.35565 Transcript_16348/m.35565 type:complete len:124 (+) Transcript_16348:223-594(+)